jgi:hypothetical protein
MKSFSGRGSILGVFATLVLGALPASSQDRVAQLSKVDGEVTVKRAGDGHIDAAQQVGPRVRNGSLFPDDVVSTAAGAAATIVFGDGTTIDLKQKTSLSIREVDLSALMAAGQRDKPLGRRIRVLAGDIAANVTKNAQIATEFETPSGVAAVKGTKLTISIAEK